MTGTMKRTASVCELYRLGCTVKWTLYPSRASFPRTLDLEGAGLARRRLVGTGAFED